MAKPKLPNQKKAYKRLEKRLIQYVASVRAIYEELNREASQIALRTDYDPTGEKPFRWADYPQTTKAVKKLQSSFVRKMETLIVSGISAEWMASNKFCDLLADKVMKAYGAKGKKKYYQVNNDAKKAFIARKDRGMNLSQKLWNQSAEYKAGLEHTLSVAIEKGMSAVTLSKRVSKYLNDFDTMKADYGKRFGKATNIYDCEYRSIRLARSEINMAYRNAEQLRWSQMDFIIGYEVKLSDNHNCKGVPNGAFYDICDDLKGRYPKDFKWSGWHPNCYDAESMVMTAEGWKYFQDVSDDDLIMSLNPATRQTEWVGITDRQVYAYDGEMMHFKSKVLDCLVTPDHPMVYVNKSDGELRICPAKDYTQGKGGFYRGADNIGKYKDCIVIGSNRIPFDLYCQFMGYWLADGYVTRKTLVGIAQKDNEDTKKGIIECISAMGYKVNVSEERVTFYDADMCEHLRQFGKTYDKFIPTDIKQASAHQIRLFLNAFCDCDGHKRMPKPFIGNHGNVCNPVHSERCYFTTSKAMATDLCECLLKVGKRPSFEIRQPKVCVGVDGKVVHSKMPMYAIRECCSLTATTFKKQKTHYNGFVYDLTLERNHIMYVSRNGKCFWGSNCRCYVIAIIKSEERFWEDEDKRGTDNEPITEMPENFNKWASLNQDRIARAEQRGTLPYFVRDNRERVKQAVKQGDVIKE